MKRILVADDSVTIQKVIALTFADEPYEVQSVGTGAEALELVKGWQPDIVLADVIMPQMNGYELCKAVKQQGETSAIPVLLLAGTFEAFDEEEARSVGADDFITKPFESGELIEKVRTLTGEMAAAAPAEVEVAIADASGIEASVVDDVVELATDEAALPEAAPQTETPSPSVDTDDVSEPDIWDILSDSGDKDLIPATDDGSLSPGFGPIEGDGVVDVGSFDVGLDRPEPPLPVVEPETPPTPEQVDVPEAIVEVPVPQPLETVSPVEPAPTELSQDEHERSRVENLERDFFGFETGAVEEMSGSDFLEDAVEEVIFDMEEPQAPVQVEAEEVSFVVPEPAVEDPVVTGETMSPDFMSPDPPSMPETPSAPVFQPLPTDLPEPAAPHIPEPVEQVPESVIPEPVVPEPIVPEPMTEVVEQQAPEVLQEFAVSPEQVPISEPQEFYTDEPVSEPPLELPVDLSSEIPDEFIPEPVSEPVSEPVTEAPALPPVEIASEPVVEEQPDISEPPVAGELDNETLMKIIEEKVEKVAWEVIPEMAEVLIREAIEKIKGDS